MRHGTLNFTLLIAICVMTLAFIASQGHGMTNWGQMIPTASPSALPDDMGPVPQVASPATTSAKAVEPATTSPKAVVQCVQPVQCVQQVQCVQTQYVPVQTIRTYQVQSAAPAAVGCQRIGLLRRLRARMARPAASSCIQTVQGVGCLGG
jgi:hypothetical protein